MYIAVIFDSSAEGTEGEIIFGEDQTILKQTTSNAVENHNSSEIESEWNGDIYYPKNDPEYGGFYWAKVYSAFEYSKFSFSEFS